MELKVNLNQVRYIGNIPKPIFSGTYQGIPIKGNEEQLICSLAEMIAPKPQPTSKKAKVIPGSEKLIYSGEIIGCTKFERYFDFFDQRKTLKTKEINFSDEFPEDYSRNENKEIDIEVVINISEARWDFKTTRKRTVAL